MIRLLAAEVAGSFNFRLAFGVARIGSSRRSSTENKRTTSSGLAGTHAARIAVQRVRPLPLLERKRLLRDVVPPQPCPVLYVNHVVGAGVSLCRMAVYRIFCFQRCHALPARSTRPPRLPSPRSGAVRSG